MPPKDTQLILDHAAATAGFFLEMADAFIVDGDFENGLKFTHLAAWALKTQNRDLLHPQVETNLRRVGKHLSDQENSDPMQTAGNHRSEHWLHVLNEASPSGGHTSMAMRWIQNDAGQRHHSVALLSQKRPIPDELVAAVRGRGGSIHTPEPRESLLGKAGWLRKLARGLASHVVLHVHIDDVIAGSAFAVNGGPRVLLVNHAAHQFCSCVSVTDLVINCRGSQLEQDWTRVYRGVTRCATVPIPLPESSDCRLTGVEHEHQKKRAREIIGIPDGSVLILTSGASYKFKPMDPLDFVSVAEDILGKVPNAFILAIGPEEDVRWKSAREKTGSRLKALGQLPRSQVPVFHQAADLYIEGFPFGSTTALLEAGLCGIPAVLAPVQCPPPYGTDGVATDEVLERPETVEDYTAKVVQLAGDSDLRMRLGSTLSAAVMKHHTGRGWNQHLEHAIRSLPATHSTYPAGTPVETPEAAHRYWTRFMRITNPWIEAIPHHAIGYAISTWGQLEVPVRAEWRTGRRRNPFRARILAEMADQCYSRGAVATAREFYACSLRSDPWRAKVHAKNLLASLGSAGVALRKVMGFVSRIGNRRQSFSTR